MVESIPDKHGDTRRLRRSFISVMAFVTVLWSIKLLDTTMDLNLIQYGVYPRRLFGLAGVVCTPLLHGSWHHLFANTMPIAVLGTSLLYVYPRSAKIVIAVVYLGSGLLVWLFARSAYHIGASGLVFGLMFFLFTLGVLRWDRRAIALSLLVFFLYGGFFLGVLPGRPGVSFESHFFGALLGVLLAFLLKRRDPPFPERKYSWETEADITEEQDDPGRLGGNQQPPKGRRI